MPDPDPGWVRRQLLRWYARHRRVLPWRAAAGERADPYRVWVSEIMLQQTRVAVVAPFYERFLERFPTVEALARAREEEVLAAWSGLGYYRRARQLHAAARAVEARHGGRVPLEMAALRALPGIGAYTAGAIASIAFGLPQAAVDGNGVRIARQVSGARLTPREATGFWTAALAVEQAGAFNQAIMDLGAMVCLPRAPRCPQCPLRRQCAGPQAEESKPRPEVEVVRHYALIRSGRGVWLRQRRAEERQLAGLWELPGARARQGALLGTFRHTITRHRITAHVYAAGRASGAGKWFTREEAEAGPLTGLARKILRRLPPGPPGRGPRRGEDRG